MPAPTVTEPVLGAIAEAIRASGPGANGNSCFRFVANDTGQPELALDTVRPGDREYEVGGKTVLVISTGLADQYSGRTLDLNEAGDFVLL